jgi:hypothetical protein
MKQNDLKERPQPEPNKTAYTGHGPEGVDKVPGEETSQDNIQFTQQSQKGKKVDADPTKENDQPIDQDL